VLDAGGLARRFQLAREPARREGDAHVAVPVARQVIETAAVVAPHLQELGPLGRKDVLLEAQRDLLEDSKRQVLVGLQHLDRQVRREDDRSLGDDRGRQRHDGDARAHEPGAGFGRDTLAAPADARHRRVQFHVHAFRVMREQRAVAARDDEVLTVLHILVRIDHGIVRRLDAFPARQIIHRHRVPGIGERLLGQRGLGRNVEPAAAGALELTVQALGDRAVAGRLGAVHAARAVVDLALEAVGVDLEAVLTRVAHPGIDVRGMQPGAATIPWHAEARVCECTSADAAARLEHDDRDAVRHQLLRSGEARTACADDEHIGRRGGRSRPRAEGSERHAGAESLQESSAIQHRIALPQISSFAR
jgi:hypothetical protein